MRPFTLKQTGPSASTRHFLMQPSGEALAGQLSPSLGTEHHSLKIHVGETSHWAWCWERVVWAPFTETHWALQAVNFLEGIFWKASPSTWAPSSGHVSWEV